MPGRIELRVTLDGVHFHTEMELFNVPEETRFSTRRQVFGEAVSRLGSQMMSRIMPRPAVTIGDDRTELERSALYQSTGLRPDQVQFVRRSVAEIIHGPRERKRGRRWMGE